MDYVRLTQKKDIPTLKPPRRLKEGGRLKVDAATRRNLITHLSFWGKRGGAF